MLVVLGVVTATAVVTTSCLLYTRDRERGREREIPTKKETTRGRWWQEKGGMWTVGCGDGKANPACHHR